MAGSGGLHIPPIPVSGSAVSDAGGLVGGRVLQGIVQGAGRDLALSVGGNRIPLDPALGLGAGQRVTVEVQATDHGTQLRVIETATPRTQPSAPLAGTGALVARTLQALGGTASPGEAAQLLPASLPDSPGAVRALLTLFVRWDDIAGDLANLARFVADAAARGAVPQSFSDGFALLAAQLTVNEDIDVTRVLERLARQGGRSTESRIARAIASGNLEGLLEELRSDLRAQVGQMRGNDALLAHLRGTGQLRAFERAAERVVERLTGHQLQNLRALEQPYLFVELPFEPGGPVERCQVHILGDGAGRRFSRDNATVVLDLSTTRLGDLWIQVSVTGGRCVCLVRAASPEAVAAVEAHAAELAAQLGDAGYPGARVRAETWDGNRFRAAADLMRRFDSLNVRG